MRDPSMFYFNISINYYAGCKYSPHPWLALEAFGCVLDRVANSLCRAQERRTMREPGV